MYNGELKEKTDFSFSRVQRQYHKKFNTIIIFVIGILTSFSYLVFIPIFFIYRKLVDIYLQWKLQDTYGGLLASEDALYIIPGDVSQCSIISLITFKCNEEVDMVTKIKDIIQKKVFDQPDSYPKLTSTIHQAFGYPYRKKNQCKVDDVVNILKVEDGQDLTEEYLKKYAANLYSIKYRKNGTMVWDVHVGNKPMQCQADDAYRYPIITRIHHSVGDGTSLFSLLIQLYGDKSSENYSKDLFKKFASENKKPTNENVFLLIVDNLKKLIKTTRLYLEMLCMSSGRIMTTNQLKPNDLNALHKPYKKYSGEKICAWSVEEKVECIPLIKNIKNKQKTKFSSVLSTAINASLSSYFKRNNLPIPEYITGTITCLLDYPDIDLAKPIILKNKMGLFIFEMPMIYGSTTIPETLKLVSEEWNKQIHFADGLAMTMLMRTMAWVPMRIIQLGSHCTSQTYILTNVPGGSVISTPDGWVIEKLVAIPPNLLGLGVSIATLSYDNKFHIGVLIDKALVSSQDEVQRIADDILLYIRILDQQTKKLN